MSEFTEVTVFVSKTLADGLLRGESVAFLKSAGDLVKAELEDIASREFDIQPGFTYRYHDGRNNTYEVVTVGDEDVVIRRMNTNSAGREGTKLLTTKDRIRSDINSDRAYIHYNTNGGYAATSMSGANNIFFGTNHEHLD